MSQARHDAAWWQLPDAPTLVVVFGNGGDRSQDEQLLPEITRAMRFQAFRRG